MEKKIKITNGKQFETLIAELEKNTCLAKGFHRGATPNNFKENWEEITLKLNSIGPPIRDSDGWQKVWRDFKFKVKRKLYKNKAEVNATGGGRFKQFILSPLEEAAANILQFQKQLNPEGCDQGPSVDETETVDIITLDHPCGVLSTFEEEDNLPSTSNTIREQPAATSSKKKRKNQIHNEERQELLQNHNNMQKKVLNEISNTMGKIKNGLKDSCRYQRKLWEVEEKKLKIMERRQQREEELFVTEMELKKIKMEIKTKELEILQQQHML